MMKALLLFLLAAGAVCAAEPQTGKSLAQVITENGVAEKLNTFGFVEERIAGGHTGRLFQINTAEHRSAVWQALRKSQYAETRQSEPKAPYFFVVLNTGSTSRDRPVEEFWIDSLGFAHFLVEQNSPTRVFLVFRAPELLGLLTKHVEQFGKPLPR